MATNFYDIVYRGKDVAPLNYNHAGEKWAIWSFVRSDEAADAVVAERIAQGFEATRVYVGKPRRRDIDA